MQFTVPEYAPYNLFIIAGVVLGAALLIGLGGFFLSKKDKGDFLFTSALAGFMLAVVSLFAIAVFIQIKQSILINEAFSQANPRVTIADISGNGLPEKENYIRKLTLIVNGTTKTIECQAILMDNTYTIECKKPNDATGTMVSIDEAIEVLEK